MTRRRFELGNSRVLLSYILGCLALLLLASLLAAPLGLTAGTIRNLEVVMLAFDWLERAFRQGDPGLVELYSSVNLASLYADPRFADLAERIGLPPPASSF